MQSEYVALHFLTLGSLGVSESDAVLRSWLTLLFTIIYTIILSAILVVCYVDPDMGSINLPTLGLIWSDLEIVKEPFFFNLILCSTISLGWIALILDILSAWCRFWFKDSLEDETEFWGKTVLLEGIFRKKVELQLIKTRL